MHVIAISARPGDANVGAAGTLRRFRERGAGVTIVTIANGNSLAGVHAPLDIPPRELASRWRAAAERSAETLDVELVWMDHSDFAVHSDAVTRMKLVDVLRARAPGLVLAPAPQGARRDERGAWRLARDAIEMAAAPNVRGEAQPHAVEPVLLAYERRLLSGFMPTEYVDVTSAVDVKRRAFEAMAQALGGGLGAAALAEPQAAAALLARHRGAQAGVDAAEAFRFDARASRATTQRLLP